MPLQENKVVLNFRGDKDFRGDKARRHNGIVLSRGRMTGKDREQKVTLQAEELTMSQRDFYT